MPCDEDNWCLDEERRYLDFGAEVFMTPSVSKTHTLIVDDLTNEAIVKENESRYTEYDEGWNDALSKATEIVNKRFGARL